MQCMSATLPKHLAGLLQPQAYPHPVDAVSVVETHLSWVLLTGQVAYKIKRPVCFPFVDLRSHERRGFYCAEELRLNRRFAPELYQAVCPVVIRNGLASIGDAGEPVEHAVKMMQFPREQELDQLLERDDIAPVELEAFGQDLAAIHAGLPVAELPAPWGDPKAIHSTIDNNLEETTRAAVVFDSASDVRALRPDLERCLEEAEPWMADRRDDGRVRECHGDLHAANMVRLDTRLVAFDCMEFEPAFRWIDVADEVAFLVADLEARQAVPQSQAFLAGYLARSGDYQACRLLPLYRAHRALVRAKVTALSRDVTQRSDSEDVGRSRHRAYLDCAAAALARQRPLLILMSGLSGSGKTWLAQRLAPLLGAVHLRSDVERKRLAGLGETSRSGSAVAEGVYSRGFTNRVYEHLAVAAEDVLAGRYNAIVDATFARRDDRGTFRKLARRLGVSVCLIHCRAPHELLVKRIIARHLQGEDPSEADVSVLDWQKEHWEPIGADEQWSVIPIETGEVDLEQLSQRIRTLHA
jgi:aminoglycoside phosphotransferase family enzyme/predicted kinase